MASSKKTVEINLRESPELRQVVARLKRANLAGDLRREIMLATADAVPQVRREVMSAPSSQSGPSKLRKAIAMAVKRRVVLSTRRAFVAIEWKPRGGKSNLGRAFEGEIPWNHPTYGHDPTVPQDEHPFFWGTLRKVSAETAIKVQKIIADFERRIMR